MNRDAARGRLAPSPTGGLHVGHARTFLAAWLSVRQAGGAVVLRIEDLDRSRVRPEALSTILNDLRRLGLDWDEGPDVGGPFAPYVQSERMGRFYAALERMKREELVYPCVCTRAEIARAASAPHDGDEGPSYPGTCSNHRAADAEPLLDKPFAWRFRVGSETISWNDLILGPQSFDPSALGGDFIVARNQHGPAYQLAVVVDDTLMAIREVIRGDDLVRSTPRQLLLYQALGWEPPRFGHLALVIDNQGRRLAKRDGAVKLSTLRESGMTTERLVGRLATSLGIELDSPNAIPHDLIGKFALDRIPHSPWVFQADDLKHEPPPLRA